MRERLIELMAQSNEVHSVDNGEFIETTVNWGEIADHLLANGVIVPPVEEGRTVWYVDDFTDEIEECKVYGFNVVNGKFSVLVDNGEEKWITRKWHNTKEEAEQALKERGQNANDTE